MNESLMMSGKHTLFRSGRGVARDIKFRMNECDYQHGTQDKETNKLAGYKETI